MKTELTKKQQNFLSFLTKYIQEKGYPPTIINDEATVKRFFRRRNNICLEPVNPNMKPIIIRKDQAHEIIIVGKVVTVLRQIK